MLVKFTEKSSENVIVLVIDDPLTEDIAKAFGYGNLKLHMPDLDIIGAEAVGNQLASNIRNNSCTAINNRRHGEYPMLRILY